ncbi:uncharacterized protein LOC112573867 [Pomacea canaliculata]|uniref:uncharacterized protein LOC112573867 n=1 Tax=Pomacea canaliculata TaxID=400727 RepID=UPI000D73B03D|nr:uncharacterized protein LOC112573867 [Pomacea canaliculata]
MKDGQLVPTQADVQCRQYLWNNPVGDVRVPIPRNVTVGWSMCINGTPTNDFYIDIEGNSSSSLPLTTTWTMASLLGLLNTNSLKVGDKLDGILSSLLTVISLTSFSVNAPGFIKITVISSSQLSIYVNNNLVYTMQLRFHWTILITWW